MVAARLQEETGRERVCANVFGLLMEPSTPGHDKSRGTFPDKSVGRYRPFSVAGSAFSCGHLLVWIMNDKPDYHALNRVPRWGQFAAPENKFAGLCAYRKMQTARQKRRFSLIWSKSCSAVGSFGTRDCTRRWP